MEVVDLPLHGGKCPPWLYPRMEKLAERIFIILDEEYGNKELLERLSDPLWFQALACILGFDWHSSGTTTTTTAAVKEALQKVNIGVYGAGGKGKTSKKTTEEIEKNAEKISLTDKKIQQFIKASKLSAKVDSAALQDGFSLYHHAFFFSKNAWIVIQQGMSNIGYARRYHWNDTENFLCEPHKAICCDKTTKPLNMTAKEVEEARKTSVDIAEDYKKYFYTIGKEKITGQTSLLDFSGKEIIKFKKQHFPKIPLAYQNLRTLGKIREYQPKNYEELLLFKGIGAKTIRALALVSELVFGTELSWKDPVKFSFAHGGKDGWPEKINRKRYDKSIEILTQAIKSAKIKEKDKFHSLKRLKEFIEN